MEELDLRNILSPEEIDSLLMDNNEIEQETPPEQKEKKENTETTETQEEGNPFESESVGSEEKEDKQGKEDTTQNESGTSPKTTNFYSSIASALREDGIFQNLDESKVKDITDPESFARAIRDEISAQFDERQKRIDEALTAGVEPSELQKYERTLAYLDSIKSEHISDESEQGEQLRRQLIYNDFINRGYSQERAQREVKKSFDAGTDIEDAKESLSSNKEFFKKAYDNILDEAKKEEEKYLEERKRDAELLKKAILEDKTLFGGMDIDSKTRDRAYAAISKPVYKDPETGELYTALQKYEMDNRLEFIKNLGIIYALTDGFKNFNNFTKGEVKKKMKSALSELEQTINGSSRNLDGTLNFVGNSGDEDSYIGNGWKLSL